MGANGEPSSHADACGKQSENVCEPGKESNTDTSNGGDWKDEHKRPRLDGKIHQGSLSKPARPKHPLTSPNSTLGIFGLCQSVTEDEMRTALAEKLPGMREYSLKMIVDERTGLSKGFCFVDFACLDDAMTAKEILSNESFRGQDFRCDYSYKR